MSTMVYCCPICRKPGRFERESARTFCPDHPTAVMVAVPEAELALVPAEGLKPDGPAPIALVDLDGTVADYDEAMERDLGATLSPGELAETGSGRGELSMESKVAARQLLRDDAWPKWLKARVDLIRNQPGWWRKLRPIERGFAVVAALEACGFQITVLTKGPRSSLNAWSEKVDWCREHLPNASVTLTEHKGTVYGKILFDDWPKYVEDWLRWRPRGLVIMPDRPYNRALSHPQVYRYTGTDENLAALRQELFRFREALK